MVAPVSAEDWHEEQTPITGERRLELRAGMISSDDRDRRQFYVMVPLPWGVLPAEKEREFIRRTQKAVIDTIRDMGLL